jgi:hypothetical protein
MIRERLQALRSAFTGQLSAVRSTVGEFAVDSLDSEIAEILNAITSQVQNASLNDTERQLLINNYSNDTATFHQAVFDVQNGFRLRFYDETLKPVMAKIHRLRLIALFLDRSNYNNYVMKTASLFEAFSRLNAELSIGLIRGEIASIQQSKTEAETAAKEYNTFGPIIEE